jgi:hypothetical protein
VEFTWEIEREALSCSFYSSRIVCFAGRRAGNIRA